MTESNSFRKRHIIIEHSKCVKVDFPQLKERNCYEIFDTKQPNLLLRDVAGVVSQKPHRVFIP